MSSLGRYLRTIRYLDPVQLAARALHAARYRAYRLAPGAFGKRFGIAAAVAAPPIAWDAPSPDLLIREGEVAERLRQGTVRYHGLEGSREDWAGSGFSRLWRYEHHYHTEMPALAAVHRVRPDECWGAVASALLESWEKANPVPRGDGWEPYPVARRLLNWSITSALTPELAEPLAPRIATHLRFLAGHLEWHLLGNHLLCDAAALVAGSTALRGPGWRRLGQRGEALLARELSRQVLGDGGYAERTAQYHGIVLRDSLVALALARARGWRLDRRIWDACEKMVGWLRHIEIGGQVPMLNDAAPDATPPVNEVLSLAAALGMGSPGPVTWLGWALGARPGSPPAHAPADLELPETGWTIVREGGSELLFEHGPIGPDEQPGHGHSDALSFELVWSGKPLVSDTGVTTYEIGDTRRFERSAEAHACVTVDDEGPDELWAAFRVGGRGRVSGGLVERNEAGLRRLDGTLRASQGWRHDRSLLFWPGFALVVVDRVKAAARRAVVSRLPLEAGVELAGDRLRWPGEPLQVRTLVGKRRDAPEAGWVGRGFGRRVPRSTLAFTANESGQIVYAIAPPDVEVRWEGLTCAIQGRGKATTITLARRER